MGKLLDSIDSPQDLKVLSLEELNRLADEIRQLLIRFCRRHGGHLGSNLATIEPIIALHRVFNMPHERLESTNRPSNRGQPRPGSGKRELLRLQRIRPTIVQLQLRACFTAGKSL